MWVVKLGGSLAYSPELPRWLNALADTDAVIVPGGGPFADAVRQTQKHWAYSDACAHDMALLGMHQYGLMLADLGGFPRFSTPDQLPRDREQPWVWLPWPDDLAKSGIQPSWEITSDSLAVWLAKRLGLRRLLLVKFLAMAAAGAQSCRTSAPSVSCDELVRTHLLDAAFPAFFRDSPLHAWLCRPNAHAHLQHGLHQPEQHFSRICAV